MTPGTEGLFRQKLTPGPDARCVDREAKVVSVGNPVKYKRVNEDGTTTTTTRTPMSVEIAIPQGNEWDVVTGEKLSPPIQRHVREMFTDELGFAPNCFRPKE